jgi:hypothetical protein
LSDDHRLGREEPNMIIIGVDYHPSVQQIALLIEETGEYDEQRLNHEGGEAERFYRDLKRKGIHVRVAYGQNFRRARYPTYEPHFEHRFKINQAR